MFFSLYFQSIKFGDFWSLVSYWVLAQELPRVLVHDLTHLIREVIVQITGLQAKQKHNCCMMSLNFMLYHSYRTTTIWSKYT